MPAMMESMGRVNDLSEDIELCGKLRSDIGNVLKYNAQKAAKVQTEVDEQKTVSGLIDRKVSHLETSLVSAESSFQDASGSLEKLELTTAHSKATNCVLNDQLKSSIRYIESSNEAFEELRKRHVSFCKLQDETHEKLASVESMLRTILKEDAQTRSCRAEIDSLKSFISDMEKKKADMLPVLESCKGELEAASAEYNKCRGDTTIHLSVIESCRAGEEELTITLKTLKSEHTELHAEKAVTEKQLAREKADVNIAVQTLNQQQAEALEEQAELLRGIEQKKHDKFNLEQERKNMNRETADATRDMRQTMEKMSKLRQRDTELVKNKAALAQLLRTEEEALVQLKQEEHIIYDFRAAQQKAKDLADEITKGQARLSDLTMMKESALIEQSEMGALLEQENRILDERLGAVETTESDVNEAIGRGTELEGLIAWLDKLYYEQKDVAHKLMKCRKQVDIQLEEVDELESRLKEQLCERVEANHENKLKRKNEEQEQALHHQLREVVSLLSEELTTLKQTKHGLQTKISQIGATKDSGAKEATSKDEKRLGELRNELKKKYEEACAELRMNCRQQYTHMLEQTLKDEEERLATEKREKQTKGKQQIEHLKGLQEENQAKILSLQSAKP